MNESQNIPFKNLGLIQPLMKALEDLQYTSPTPIQSQSIPILLEGYDLLGCAQTGTGKTAAFALPILQLLHGKKKKPGPRQALTLILTPTRELALQIFQSFKDYGKYLDLKSACIFGGVGQGPQVQALAQGVDILVATPGRLLDLMDQRYLTLERVETFVLDEADRMLDMGFIQDIRKILPKLPAQRQSLFFSATMPKDILQLAEKILKNPKSVKVDPVSSTAELIEQSVCYVDRSKKKDLLKYFLDQPEFDKVIVFTRTKHGANRVSEFLNKNKISALPIHGNKSQGARQKALEGLKTGDIRVLIATDIVARGIDVESISHVINYEIPHQPESYVHRIGRTARAGAQGIALSFCDEDEKSLIREIEKTIGQGIPLNKNHPHHSLLVENAKFLSKGQAKAKIEGAEKSQRGGGTPRRYFKPKKKF